MLLFHVGLHFPRLLFKERKWEWNFNCQSEISTNTYTVITALHSSCSFACCHRPCPQEDIFPGLCLKTQFPNRKSSMNCKWSFSLGMSPASTVMIIEPVQRQQNLLGAVIRLVWILCSFRFISQQNWRSDWDSHQPFLVVHFDELTASGNPTGTSLHLHDLSAQAKSSCTPLIIAGLFSVEPVCGC